ncbi:MAG: YIP1 family protein [Gammaproteobacteria bacterium]|nr:YIP1 family protein [Gammaproteobacteria bacterium]MYD76126.1 YIP1 family protein [Gammaproteobacteria bacterium]MYJ53219.1 YIP1 family protein [Gammaproteobacteria bacterium]
MVLRHFLNILFRPAEAWQAIRSESWTIGGLYLGTIVPLAAIPPLAGYYGTTHHGWQIAGNAPVRLTPDSALPISIAYFIAILVAFYVIALLIQWMSSTYGERQPLVRCLALAVYSAIPLLLIGVVQAYPVLWVNLVAGLVAMTYAVYLLYRGVPIVMDIPDHRGFLFASAVLAVSLVSLVATLAASVILWDHGIGPMFTH